MCIHSVLSIGAGEMASPAGTSLWPPREYAVLRRRAIGRRVLGLVRKVAMAVKCVEGMGMVALGRRSARSWCFRGLCYCCRIPRLSESCCRVIRML